MGMVAKEIINQNIPTIPLQVSVEESLNFFEESSYDYLPVIDNNYYIGLLPYLDIEVQDKSDKLINQLNIIKKHFIAEEALFTDILESFLKNETNILPIIKRDNTYIGSILFEDFKDYCVDSLFLFHEGISFEVILTSEKKISDVVFLIESEGAQILSLLPKYDDLNTNISLSIKINKKNTDDVFSLLRLKKYKVIENTSGNDAYKELYKKRIDEFFKYMNI